MIRRDGGQWAPVLVKDHGRRDDQSESWAMESTLHTIESTTGVYRSEHPSVPGRTVAWLFHDPSFAAETIAQAANPSELRVVPVADLDQWLEGLLTDDITHVIEYLLPNHSTERTTAGWLLMLRAKQSGREYQRRG
jgi:hypothetical protein